MHNLCANNYLHGRGAKVKLHHGNEFCMMIADKTNKDVPQRREMKGEIIYEEIKRSISMRFRCKLRIYGHQHEESGCGQRGGHGHQGQKRERDRELCGRDRRADGGPAPGLHSGRGRGVHRGQRCEGDSDEAGVLLHAGRQQGAGPSHCGNGINVYKRDKGEF